MSRRADTGSARRGAEAKFPHRVDIPIPIGGLGSRLTEMLMWCRANIAPGTWDQHAHGERPKRRGGIPAVAARFYFASEPDAGAFRKLWAAD